MGQDTPSPPPWPAVWAAVSQPAWLGLQALGHWLRLPVPYSAYPRAAALGLALGLLALTAATLFVFVPWARRWWTNDPARPNEDERGVSTVEMTLIEHLLELRTRLMIAIGAVVATTVAAFIFYQRWFDIAVWPIRGRGNCPVSPDVPPELKLCLQAITPTELIFSYFKVTLVVGLILAMPVIAYEVWQYLAPGLTRQERRYVLAVVPGASLAFLAGVLFAYFALMPAALTFLLGFGGNDVEIKSTVASYISFITHLLIAIGLVFELPVVLFFLAKVHLINARMLGTIRRYVIVIAFIVAAVVTPTPDPFNQLLVAIPILVLYEVGVLLTRLA